MITFDEEKHEYRLLATGELLLNVTSVLNELDDFRYVPEETLNYARDLGRAVHLACEYYDAGTLEWASVDAPVRPYVDAYARFIEREKPTILWNEQKIYHPKHRYAGKPDAGVVLYGERGILDRKTCRAIDLGLVGPQTAAYKAAKNCELALALSPEDYLREQYVRRWALQLMDDGKYRLAECRDAADEAVFLSCLTIRRWRDKHGYARG